MGCRRGFTLIELLVVIAIVLILAGVMFPVLAGARQRARLAQCTSNLRQLAFAMRQYVDDAGGVLPEMVAFDRGGRPWRWTSALYRYVGSEEIYTCPHNPVYLDPASRPEPLAPLPETSYYYCSYALGGMRETLIKQPSTMILLMDGWYFRAEGGPRGLNYPMYYSPWATPQVMADWVNNVPTRYVEAMQLAAMRQHNGGVVAAFVDGHAARLSGAQPEQFTLLGE